MNLPEEKRKTAKSLFMLLLIIIKLEQSLFNYRLRLDDNKVIRQVSLIRLSIESDNFKINLLVRNS